MLADGGGDQSKPDSIGLDSLPGWQRDLIDHANETAGRETGRAKRFNTGDDAASLQAKEREKEEAAFNRLMHLLRDPEYAKLYNETRQIADRASDAVAAALEKNTLNSAEADQRLQEINDSAATLPDGRKVFRSADGRLRAEDGSDVTDQRGSVSGLSDKSPSWEEYEAAKARREALRAEREEIERYRQNVLDPARQRLNDPDNPYSKDELRKTGEELRDKMPPSVRAAYERSAPSAPASAPAEKSAAEKYIGAYELKTPDVGAQFSTAHDAKTAQPDVAPLVDLPLKSTP